MSTSTEIKHTLIEKIVNKDMQEVSEEIVEQSKPIVCNNIVSIRTTDDCPMTGAVQVCNAYGKSKLFSEPAINEKLGEKVEESLRETLTSKVETLDIKVKKKNFPRRLIPRHQLKVSSFVDKSTISITKSIKTRMKTVCDNAVYGMNVQLTQGTTCKASGSIDFGNQRIAVSSLSTCAVNTSGQDTTDYNDGKTEQLMAIIDAMNRDFVPKGIDPVLSNFLVYFTFAVIIFFSGQVVFYQGQGGHVKITKGICTVVSLMLLIFTWKVWPGDWALENGGAPFSYPYTETGIDGDQLCKDGKLYRDIAVSKFGFLKKKPDGEYEISGYEQCGVFGGACGGTKPATDSDAFRRAKMACFEAPVGVVDSCDTPTLFDKLTTKVEYAGCKKCDGRYGLFDADADCETAPDPNPAIYGSFGELTGIDGEKIANICPPNTPACISDIDTYVAASPGECTNVMYQKQKEQVVSIWGSCQRLLARTRGITGSIKERCPPRLPDYLECEKYGACTYEPPSPAQKKGCANDLTGCTDKGYLIDKSVDDMLSERCGQFLEDYIDARNNTGVLIFIYFLWFCVIAICYSVCFLDNNRRRLAVPVPVFALSSFFLIPVVYAIFGPGGLVMASQSSGEFVLVGEIRREDGEVSRTETEVYRRYLAFGSSIAFLFFFTMTSALSLPRNNFKNQKV